MTLTVNRAEIGDIDFSAAVKDHCDALQAWVTKEGVPPPVAAPLVEQSVKRVRRPGQPDQFVPDFQIIEPSAQERKASAVAASRKQEQAEIAALMPEGKARLFQMEYEEACMVAVDDRTPDQNQTIADMADLTTKIRAIRRAGAVREAAIDDQFA